MKKISPLQLACGQKSEKSLQIIEYLLLNGADPNNPNAEDRTPLFIAATLSNYEAVKLLLKYKADVNLCHKRKQLVKSNSTFYLLDDFNKMEMCSKPYWGVTPLHQAVRNNDKQTVRLLLENGAFANAIDDHGITPILLAGASAENMGDYEEILWLLIQRGADVDACSVYTGGTALHNAAIVGSLTAVEMLLQANARLKKAKDGQTPLHEAAGRGNLEIVKLLLKYTKNDRINEPDMFGKTPLHKAAFCGSRECVEVLMDNGGDLSIETKSNITVFDAIFRHVPRPVHLIKKILDKKITCNNTNYNSVDFKIFFDFRMLTPGKIQQMSVMAAMLKAGKDDQMKEIMQHPLIETFLRMKWNDLRIFFILLVGLYFIFVLSLSSYSLLAVAYNWSNGYHYLTNMCQYILFFTSTLLFSHGILQCILMFRLTFKQFELWLNLLCSTLAFTIAFIGNEKSYSGSRELPDLVLHLMSIAIFLAWMQLMMLIGRFPIFGYYALMFVTVLQNVLKVLLTFICLILGFAFSFSIQFHMDLFDNPLKAIVKTFVMMMGEYEYRDLFPMDNTEPQYLPYTSRLIFVAFIIVVSIVLMNLLVGIAVNDIQDLKTTGVVQRFIKQAMFLSHLEMVLSHSLFNMNILPNWLKYFFFKKKIVPSLLMIKPGQYNAMKGGLHEFLPPKLLESAIRVALHEESKKQNEETSMMTIVSIVKDLQREISELKAVINNKNVIS